MKMTFRMEISDSESEEEADENDETEVVVPKVNSEDETEKDEELELIQALIIRKNQRFQDNIEKVRGIVPLAQYVSPNGSPQKFDPDLDKNDLRWLIEGQKQKEKQRIRELEYQEKMLAANEDLFEKEQSEIGAPSGQDRFERPTAKPQPETEMPGLCGCSGLCEYYGLCLNLDNYEDIIVTSHIQPYQMDFLNKTI